MATINVWAMFGQCLDIVSLMLFDTRGNIVCLPSRLPIPSHLYAYLHVGLYSRLYAYIHVHLYI